MRKIDGIPGDEMLLAKLIQNANQAGVKSCVGEYQVFKNGKPETREYLKGVCAMGAAMLSPDTNKAARKIDGNIIGGNDLPAETASYHDDALHPGVTVGIAFRNAVAHLPVIR